MRDPHAGSNPRAPTPARRLMVTAVAALALSACAGGPPGGPGGRQGPGGPAVPTLFISPFGQPFVAGPDDPWPVADWFLGADADLDGGVTFDEFAADGVRWFGRLDSDRDGRLNQTELAAYEASLHGFGPGAGGPAASSRAGGEDRRGGGRRGPGGEALAVGEAPQSGGGARGGRRSGGARGPRGYGIVAEAGFFNLPQPVKAADVNVDQRVTTQEWATATQRWFLALDTDHDGRLTLATLPKTPLQQRVEARKR
ncbi:hypothetical protein [Brevundimonas sp.]|uniref:hypothetical protein n=1 Tax=Brevundimonas sp. TaxID=1871086 RepID=UPI002CDDBCF4|nr:hypothetical protein [Brevundimonas sp.]HWQ87085.1 hypothetical protein [Brevundimonas sp.]